MSCVGRTTIICFKCSIEWDMPDEWVRRRKEDHAWWHCPNGHTQHWSGPSKKELRITELEADVVRLKRLLTSAIDGRSDWRKQAEHETRRRTGYQGALAKERKLRLMA